MKNVIGRCSCCGGDVSTPVVWHGTNPPVPQCDQCGAIAKNMLPIVEMEQPIIGIPKMLLNENNQPT